MRLAVAAVAGVCILAASFPSFGAPQLDGLLDRFQKSPKLTSFLPSGALEDFVVSQFDIRTINSSMNRGREPYQARLTELGYRAEPHRHAGDPLVLKSDDGTITLSLFERGDHNLDGIEDVLVCMTDRTKDGRFSATQPLVLQKFSDTTPLVALAVGVEDSRCPRGN
jgi:hypothetical protein